MSFDSSDSCDSTEIIQDSQGESSVVVDDSQKYLRISFTSEPDTNVSLQISQTSPNCPANNFSVSIKKSPVHMTSNSAILSMAGPSGTTTSGILSNAANPSHSTSLELPSISSVQVPVQYGTPPKSTSTNCNASWKRSASPGSIESPHSKRFNVQPRDVTSPDSSAQAVIQPCTTPKKRSTLKFESPITPNRDPALNLFESEDPSPYKSIRPKFLPKNCKQHKKKYDERQKYLESVREIEKKWAERTPMGLVPVLTPEHKPTVVDPCGFSIPQLRWFSPERYFVSFNEENLNVNDFVPPDSPLHSKSCREIFVYLQNASNYTPTVKECRFFFYWLSVTRKRHVVGFVVSFLHQRFLDRSLYLGWRDVQQILINFGLTKDPPQHVSAVGSKRSQTSPQPWNIEFFLYLLENSYFNYNSTRLIKNLSFLMGALFEPLFSQLKSRVSSLANKIIVLLISQGIDEKTLLDYIDLDFCSNCCNRYIFQMLSSDPALCEFSQKFAVKMIEGILNKNSDLGIEVSRGQIMNDLEKNIGSFEKLDLRSLFQVVMVVEKLLLMEESKSVRSDGVHRLSSFLQKVCQRRHRFERVYLDDTIRRIKLINS